MWGPNSASQVEAGSQEFPLIVRHVQEVRLMARVYVSLSYPFQCGYFFSGLWVGVVRPVSRFLTEGTAPLYTWLMCGRRG